MEMIFNSAAWQEVMFKNDLEAMTCLINHGFEVILITAFSHLHFFVAQTTTKKWRSEEGSKINYTSWVREKDYLGLLRWNFYIFIEFKSFQNECREGNIYVHE